MVGGSALGRYDTLEGGSVGKLSHVRYQFLLDSVRESFPSFFDLFSRVVPPYSCLIE